MFNVVKRCVLAASVVVLVARDAAAEQPDDSRLRVGFHINGGAGVSGGGGAGPAFGAAFQLGWQLDHRMAAYAHGSIFRWLSPPKTSEDRNITSSGLLGFELAPLFAGTLGDRWEVAAGPSIDRLITTSSSSIGVANTTGSSTRTSSGAPVGYGGTFFGLHGRLAFHIVATPAVPDRRASFTFGADLHPVLANGGYVLTFFTLGFGGDFY